MLSSNEIKALIVALGVGIGDSFDISKLRYDRIIIMTDADVDGAHIRTLLLTFFFRNMTSLIEEGHIYIAQPPLYKIKKGKEERYVYTEDEKLAVMKELGMEGIDEKGNNELEEEDYEEEEEKAEGAEENIKPRKSKKHDIQRYKGLGEMNPGQLWDTTMNPENRILLKVTVEDAAKADETFSTLMGDEVPPRKRFIQTHAKAVKNLDI